MELSNRVVLPTLRTGNRLFTRGWDQSISSMVCGLTRAELANDEAYS